MWLLIYYLIFVAVGDVAAYLIGIAIERVWGSYPSLVVFLSLYFAVLWIAWVVAVRVTAPKHSATSPG